MTFEEFQQLSRRTQSDAGSQRERVLLFALGLANESGEVCGVIKKWVRHGPTAMMDRADLISELGDTLWYLAALASTCDVDLEEIAHHNVDKLRARYPDGFCADGGHRV
jgi:NTP pyrophosphatase (non-canonical NTP hydrolase)